MEGTQLEHNWRIAIEQTYEHFFLQLVGFIPQLLGAVFLLIIGWLLATFLRILTKKFVRGLDTLIQKAARHQGIERTPSNTYEKLIGGTVYWITLLFFFSASAHMLKWKFLTQVSSTLLDHLPNMLIGIAIISAGFALSNFVKSAVSNAAESAGLHRADMLGQVSRVTLILLAIIVGVEQLGVHVTFITTTVIVTFGVLLSGLALAFGIGAQQFIANIVGTHATKKHYQPGQLIKIGNVQGYILEITSTTIILDTENGRAAVPAKFFHETISEFIDETSLASEVSSNEP